MSEPRGEWYRRPTNRTAVVFIHGVLSDADSCWRAGDVYWPDLLANEDDLVGVGIYVFSYRTGIFTAGYSLGDAVEALNAYLELDHLFEFRNLVFVCHSMGGILARQLLVTRQSILRDRALRIGLFLIASPSLGSDYANLLHALARVLGHSQADVLRFSAANLWLNDLDRNFINLKESNIVSLEGKELVEDEFIVIPRLIRRQVVPPFSGAKYFGDSLKIPGSNHFTIAKPTGKDALQHRLLLQFILKFLTTANPSAIQEPQRKQGPNLEIKLVNPVGARVILPRFKYKFSWKWVEARLRAEAARRGLPNRDWTREALADRTKRIFEVEERRSSEHATDEEIDWHKLMQAAKAPASEREEYAINVERWYSETDQYLGLHYGDEISFLRGFYLDFELLNSGNSVADSVRVDVFLPPIGIAVVGYGWPHAELSFPRTPACPNSIKDQIRQFCEPCQIESTESYQVSQKRPLKGFMAGPEWVRDRTKKDRQAFSAIAEIVKSGESKRLRSFSLTFGDAESFDLPITYRVHASNQSEDCVGELKIVVCEE